MTEKEMCKYLESHFYAEKKIKALETECNQLRLDAQGITSPMNGIPSATMRNSAERRLLELADKESELITQIESLREEQKKVRNLITKLKDNDLEAVLIYRFILHNTTEKTAELMNYSPETVKRKQKTATKKLTQFDPI